MAGERSVVAERYRLTSQIGSGGMGRVWLARDEVLHRDVAVKEVVLPDGLTEAERDDLCDRTLREARAAGRLSHPNVVQVYDVVQFEGRPWIVMEFVRSRSLYQVIKQDGPLPPKRAAEIGLSIVEALRAAHAAGVWHRDVKPGNVLLAEDGRVVLTDFGLATFDGDGAVTRSGLILGSAQYISPERARDGVSGPQSDMWSLGATLYAAVEGRSPYARESSMATLTALATLPPDPPRRAGPLRGVLIGLLRKNPRHRLTVSQAAKELQRVVDGEARGRGRLLLPRPRAEAVTPVDGASAGGPAVGTAPAPPGSGPLPNRRSHLQTATEETYRVPARRGRRWQWLALGLLLAAAVPVTVVMIGAGDGGDPVIAPPSGSPSATAPPLTAAMGIEGCLRAIPGDARTVTGPTIRARDNYMLAAPGWVFYPVSTNPDGSRVTVGAPPGWRAWTEGATTCLRDPEDSTPVTAIGIVRQGRRDGEPVELIEADVAGWMAASGVTAYEKVKVQDLLSADGGAWIEYTYRLGGQDMHSKVWLVRWQGELYLYGWTSRHALWSADGGFADVMFQGFDVER